MTDFWIDNALQRVLSHPTDVRTLRESAAAFLDGCTVESVTDALLVIDTLASAAYDQGRLPATLRLVREGTQSDWLRISLAAPGIELPSADSGFGTGLHVLTTCAALWGRSGEGDHAALWAHLPLVAAVPAALHVAFTHGVAPDHRPAAHP
ncbi:hypothetical protein L1857_24855 [Amycolatopsis thermalba]|uniref:ATP-binding protein n=1 Tax=Amycolatopsis thermalba TaxID=944492 RepID=A0ABY4P0K0_9PSEU|nr:MULTISPECIES: hypothetical protein [Amycolatopsis]OXM63409.1 hypothetical protein CF166_31655 [Amycolatopsis sp. KNN50.9b]UQS25806.1 hypothetical protein L1857_24855 [Amycolatopsis thermalba]